MWPAILLMIVVLLMWGIGSFASRMKRTRENYAVILAVNPEHPFRKEFRLATGLMWVARSVVVSLGVGILALFHVI